jgi:hypothetical protein
MTTEHTPGPWRVRGGAAKVFAYDIVGPNGEDIGYANSSDGADEPAMYPVEANARLIAAAPDLIEALRGILEIGKRDLSNPKYDGYFASAVAAIAKAEGRGCSR